MPKAGKLTVAIVAGILGLLGIVAAIIYMTVQISSLPSILPGRTFLPGHVPDVGHYHKRAALAAFIGVVLLAVALLAMLSARRSGRSGTQPLASESTAAGEATASPESSASSPE